jgi:hypothetical protein
MKKKILIGSMLVLTLLLLMPTIPAIQQKSIEERIERDLREKLDEIDVEKIKDLLYKKSLEYSPLLLNLLIFAVYRSRTSRGFLLHELSVYYVDEWDILLGYMRIRHPILFFRSLWLLITAVLWIGFCETIYYYMGWDWQLPY